MTECGHFRHSSQASLRRLPIAPDMDGEPLAGQHRGSGRAAALRSSRRMSRAAASGSSSASRGRPPLGNRPLAAALREALNARHAGRRGEEVAALAAPRRLPLRRPSAVRPGGIGLARARRSPSMRKAMRRCSGASRRPPAEAVAIPVFDRELELSRGSRRDRRAAPPHRDLGGKLPAARRRTVAPGAGSARLLRIPRRAVRRAPAAADGPLAWPRVRPGGGEGEDGGQRPRQRTGWW